MKYCGLTDIGLLRPSNQDAYKVIRNSNSDILFVLCDGIGGGLAGDVASQEAINYLSKLFRNTEPFVNGKDVYNFLYNALEETNRYIYNLSVKYTKYNGMGTTITGILISGKYAYDFNIGDSRVYGILNNKISQLTYDDTLVNKMIENGEITEEEAKFHPKRSHLIKALGVNIYTKPHIERLNFYDYFVICSDGLYTMVDEQKINSIMITKTMTLENKIKALLNESLLNGGSDNITIITVDCNE